MPKDRSERRTYRKSPGRQYGYNYDPLHSQSGQQEDTTEQGESASRSGTLMAHRPDPRRTRQLLRKTIISSKTRPPDEDTEQIELSDDELALSTEDTEREHASHSGSPYPTRNGLAHPHLPSTRELMDEEEEQDWGAFAHVDPHLDYEDEDEFDFPQDPVDVQPEAVPLSPISRRVQGPPLVERSRRPPLRPHEQDDEAYDDDYDEEEELPPLRPRPRSRRRVSRRGILIGMGLVAAGGTGLAAYELAPKVPQALGDVGSNVEHQLQDAFNKGVAQGADNARKEFVTALENLEGFSLDGAITAARLTRVAYDTFVSPIIQAGSTLTGEILSGMLGSFKTARKWLAGASLDNATLAAIEKVLQSWVDTSSKMPKQINSITQADLDGAQAYLRALQRKIEAEKTALNSKKMVAPPANMKH